jgi:hypothetical protein
MVFEVKPKEGRKMNTRALSLLGLVFTLLLVGCAQGQQQTSGQTGFVTTTPLTIIIPTSSVTPTQLPTATLGVPAISEDREGCVITAPPADLNLDPWFVKYCDAHGIHIVGSENVGDTAMRQGYYVAMNFFAPIPDLKNWLVQRNFKLAVYDSQAEKLFEMPGMETTTQEGGGMMDGGQGLVVSYESDLLCADGWKSAYAIHELGHAVDFALYSGFDHELVDNWLSRVEDAYAAAVEQNLWAGSYMITNSTEYWAEGVTAYFNVYWDAASANDRVKKDELATYDPLMFALADDVFRGFDWEATCP